MLNTKSKLSEEFPVIDWISGSAAVLRNFRDVQNNSIKNAVSHIISCAPLRRMKTPGGCTMSVAMTNCGEYGWVSDMHGYRYNKNDPLTGTPWPEMPDVLKTLANNAASVAGFPDFSPDVCLINQYQPGAKLSLHQDKDEADFTQPIVSVSLGVPAMFLFGGLKRKDKTTRINLMHGDVVVWGKEDRLCYHGILPLKQDYHPDYGHYRINLTFRKAD